MYMDSQDKFDSIIVLLQFAPSLLVTTMIVFKAISVNNLVIFVFIIIRCLLNQDVAKEETIF